MKPAIDQVDTIIQSVRPASRATLIQLCGDIDMAEVALLYACKLASNQWRQCLPDNPVIWLIHHGRNNIVEKRYGYNQQLKISNTTTHNNYYEQGLTDYDSNDLHDSLIKDDILRLLFCCCHPVLSQQAQMALTLHMISDLSAHDIAHAFLVTEKNMQQRIKIAKNKIKQEQINYEIPNTKELPSRLSCVLKTIYLIFNEGYQTNHGKAVILKQLCEHAIRLARRLLSLFPGDDEVIGLLTLLLFQHARFDERMSPDHRLLTLEEQDRSNWNHILINEARALLNNTRLHSLSGPYQLQATIAALHCQGKCFEDTDWHQINILYEYLKNVQPSPIVRLNQIMALSHARGVSYAWSLLQELNSNQWLLNYAPYFAVKAYLLARMQKPELAIEVYKQAKSLTTNAAEVQYIQTKIDQLEK